MKAKSKQPIPEKGFKFTGWAIFNWGFCHHEVYRTRKEARDACWKGNVYFDKEGKRQDATCWNDVKDHMAIAKVECVVIK